MAEALDVWLRIPEGEEESEAEANTYAEEDGIGYRVEWYLTAVGLVTEVPFTTLEDAHDFLRREGFEDYTS